MLRVVHCANCGKKYFRSARRFNEAIKFRWKQYCSNRCQFSAKTTKIKTFCARKGCQKKVFRIKNQFLRYGKAYCSHRCSAIVSNSLREKKIRICQNPNCGKEFTGRKKKYCSLACIPLRDSQYNTKVVLDDIQNFYKKHRRIPIKREMYYLYKAARKHFGTWNNTIKEAGFNPNPVMFAKKYTSKDGHKCDSLSEKIIDDWLYRRKILHKRNTSYPGNFGLKVDFLVKDKWIEFFGLSGQHKRYDELHDKKLKLAKKFNLKLIGIYPKDLFPENKLENVLGSFLYNQNYEYCPTTSRFKNPCFWGKSFDAT